MDAWFSGLRKTEGRTRKNYEEIEKKGNLIKINPILEWTELDIWIPKNKAFTNTIIYRLLARFTELFTLLRNFQKLWQRYLFI